MKILYICGILFVTYFQVSLGYLPEKYLEKHDYECIREMNITQETVQAAFADDFILEEGNPVINEFAQCTFKKLNYMNQDGSINFPNIKTWLTNEGFKVLGVEHVPNQDEIIDKAMTQCEAIEGSDNSDTAVKTYNCFIGFLNDAGKSHS